MPNLTLTIGQLKITPFFWSLCFAFVISSFSFWRRLKEEYKEEEIFGLTLFIGVGGLLFSWFSLLLFNNSRFLSPFAFLGAVLAVKLWSFNFKVNIWEVFDAMGLSFLYFLFFGGIGYFFKSGSFWDLGYVGAGLLGFVVFEFSRKKYRSFSWYKSGKIGFLFWEVSLVVFLILSGLAFLRRGILYWEGSSLVLIALLSIFTLYYRSERNLKEDLRNIFLKK